MYGPLNRDPVSQQVLHDKESTLLKDRKLQARLIAGSSSLVMFTFPWVNESHDGRLSHNKLK
jgi:hypothetical protein